MLKQIGFVPQLPPPLKMPVGELLRFSAAVSGIKVEPIALVAGRLGLDVKAFARQPFVKLSGGQKQKLLIAIALGRDAELLMMDEPAANLDPEARHVFFSLLAERTANATMLISSHRLDEVAALVNRVIELDRGKVVLDDRVADAALGGLLGCSRHAARRRRGHRQGAGRVGLPARGRGPRVERHGGGRRSAALHGPALALRRPPHPGVARRADGRAPAGAPEGGAVSCLRLAPLAALLAVSCAREAASGPAEVKVDRDTCTGCSMVICDLKYAAQVQGPGGAPRKFDDLGCAITWLRSSPSPRTRRRPSGSPLRDGGWVDARAERYAAGKTTPMAYGFAPRQRAGRSTSTR